MTHASWFTLVTLLGLMLAIFDKASNTILTFCLVGAIVLSTVSFPEMPEMSTWLPEYLSTSLLSFRPQQNFQVLFVLTIINYDPTAQYPTACDYPTEAERVEMLVEYKSLWKVAGSSWGQLSVTRCQDRCCANVLFCWELSWSVWLW